MKNEKIKKIKELYGDEDNRILLKKLEAIADNIEECNITRAGAYCAMGEIISYFAPELSEDIGYSYFKKALELDENNLDARLGICLIFNTYPYPLNDILTEKEYLYHMSKLINNIQEELSDQTKHNILESLKGYITYRKKIIDIDKV